MNIDFISKRITQLRIKKGISEYKMSHDLGHGKSYINGIANGKSLPSIPELLYMCEYFEITPMEFFDEKLENPALIQKALDEMQELQDKDLILLITLISRLKEKNE